MDIGKLVFGIQHIGIPTADVAKTVAFYTQFGFVVDWEKGDTPEDRVAFLKNGSCVIETYYSEAPAGVHGAIDHIAMDVTDIKAVYDYCLSLGYESLEGRICSLPFFERGVSYFTILGPNGEKFEFNQRF